VRTQALVIVLVVIAGSEPARLLARLIIQLREFLNLFR
jgi:hypothetical protein